MSVTFLRRTIYMAVALIIGALFMTAGLDAAYGGSPEFGVYTGNLKAREQAYVPGQVLVKFNDKVHVQQRHRIARQAGGRVVGRGYKNAYDKMRVPEDKLWRVIDALERNPLVDYADPDYLAYAAFVPNDPMYQPYQWHLDNPDFGGIEAEQAWDVSTGAGSVVVAVLDTGIAYENYGSYCQAPDLAGTAFVQGYDFINGDAHANDDQSHGTHVAGTIAQATDNGTGVAGVAFKTTLMPVKVLGADGSGSISAIADGIRFAADNGVKVINMSLGTDAPPPRLRTLEDAVKYAHGKGVLLVAAAGNDGKAKLNYPAGYAEVIAVGATSYDETLAPYSNSGDGIELVAPGGDSNEDLNGDGYPDMVLQNTLNPNTQDVCDFGYWFFSGTSMASPHVAGTAALVFAAGVDSAASVRQILRDTADDLGDAGYDTTYGYGIVNAAKALNAIGPTDDPPTVAVTAPVNGETITGTITITADAADDNGVTQVDFLVDGTVIASDTDGSDGWSAGWDTTAYADGDHTVGATAMDTEGQTATDTVTVTVDNVDSPPAVAVTSPVDGAIVGGTITVSADASDDNGVTQVEFYVDGTSIGTDTDGSDGWSAGWDTTAYADGDHTVSGTATDTAGQTAADTVTVTVDNTIDATMHVGDLDGSTINQGRTWVGQVTVTVHDDAHSPVANAEVMVNWSGGYTATETGVTNADGQVTFSTPSLPKSTGSVTLGIYDVAHAELVYDSSKNHDPDGDSDGTSITVSK